MSISDKPSVVHVAVGVILNPASQILIAKRAANLHQGGLWEFPGGKVDAGESVQQALSRELMEELAIGVSSCSAFMEIHHDYGDKSVFLDVWIVDAFEGEARGNEGQAITWVDVLELEDYEFPKANETIVSAIKNLKL